MRSPDRDQARRHGTLVGLALADSRSGQRPIGTVTTVVDCNFLGVVKVYVVGKAPTELVFPGSRSGRPLRAPVFRASAFDAAAAEIGRPGLHPHELRHTAASLAIASGADVKVVQQMLGHASAAMTLDQYGQVTFSAIAWMR